MKAQPIDTPADAGDADLARRAGDRDDPTAAAEAFRLLHDRHAPLLLGFLIGKVGRSRAEDALQETWLAIWNALGTPGRFDGANFRAWSHRIARNLLIDAHRRPTLPTLALDDARDAPIDPRRSIDAEQDLRDRRKAILARCLETLDPDERLVVTLIAEGAKAPEIAGRIGKDKVQTIYRLLYDAKAKLKSCAERSDP